MVTHIVLLRGINVGAANRIKMPVLVEALSAAGFSRVRTYLQSGNVLADGDPEQMVAVIRELIDVPCVTRSAADLDRAITANPFADVAAENPKLMQVTFRAEAAESDLLAALETRLSGGERVAVQGREIYSWHPQGLARSKLGQALTPRARVATARNWTTVLALAEMARA